MIFPPDVPESSGPAHGLFQHSLAKSKLPGLIGLCGLCGHAAVAETPAKIDFTPAKLP